MRFLKSVGLVLLTIFGLYLIGRAVAELFLIDYHNPASYRHDWGGPTLVGVMAVHMLPGAISLIALVCCARRVLRLRKRT